MENKVIELNNADEQAPDSFDCHPLHPALPEPTVKARRPFDNTMSKRKRFREMEKQHSRKS